MNPRLTFGTLSSVCDGGPYNYGGGEDVQFRPISTMKHRQAKSGVCEEPPCMDAATQHRRFKALFASLARSVGASGANDPTAKWLLRCFRSLDFFLDQFPDRDSCERWLSEREAMVAETKQQVPETVDRLISTGFDYTDLEQLRFPPQSFSEDAS